MAHPQHPATPIQVDNAESTSKPDDKEIPEANPARPTITNPAHIPPVGYLQFEQGLLLARTSPNSLARQLSLVQSARLSVHPRLMLLFDSQPTALTHLLVTPSTWDPGDLQLGGQGLLTLESGYLPTIALAYTRRIRAGDSPDLDIGTNHQSVALLVSGDLGDFHYDSNLVTTEQVETTSNLPNPPDTLTPPARTPPPARRAQFGQTLAITHDLFGRTLDNRLELTGELWHFTEPLINTTIHGTPSPRSNAVGTLWTATFALRPDLVLDAGFDHGLTSTSTQWQAFTGATYLLPHRLWPHRTPPPATLPDATPRKHHHRR